MYPSSPLPTHPKTYTHTNSKAISSYLPSTCLITRNCRECVILHLELPVTKHVATDWCPTDAWQHTHSNTHTVELRQKKPDAVLLKPHTDTPALPLYLFPTHPLLLVYSILPPGSFTYCLSLLPISAAQLMTSS